MVQSFIDINFKKIKAQSMDGNKLEIYWKYTGNILESYWKYQILARCSFGSKQIGHIHVSAYSNSNSNKTNNREREMPRANKGCETHVQTGYSRVAY